MLSMKMWAALHVVVLVAIYCATAQTEPQEKTHKPAEANAKQVEINDIRPNQDEVNVPRPSPPPPVHTGNDGPAHKRDQDQDQDQEQEEFEVRETRVSRDISPIHITLVEYARKGQGKRALSLEAKPIPYVICYFFTNSYSDPTNQRSFRKATDFISSRVCVTFIDITLTLNASDPDSPLKLGCKSRFYLSVILDSSCYAPVGMPQSLSGGTISPCTEMTVILHEVEHVVLAIHAHMGQQARASFSILFGNIQKQYLYAFGDIASYSLSIDGATTQRYPSTFLSENGEPTVQCMRYDQCVAADFLSTEETLVAELNFLYKCNEYVCGNSTIDCWPGYFAKENGVCQCICPKIFDRKTNCKTLVNGPFGPTWWPTPATILSGGNNVQCPAGTASDGTLSICGNAPAVNPGPTPFASANSSTVTYLQFCSVNSSKSNDMYEWPFGGNPCFIKPKGIPCTGRFNSFRISFTNYCPVIYNGTAADITVIGNLTIIIICCKQEVSDFNVNYPNDQSYTLFAYTRCPKVEGMRGTLDFLAFNVANRTASGGPYKVFTYDLSYGFYWYMCFLRPPVYGCNLQATFGITLRSVTFVTPGFPGPRPPNRRCIFYAALQKNFAGFVRLTINLLSLESDDLLTINRYGPFNSKAYLPIPTPVDLISEEYLFYVEFYSGFSISTKSGINVTMDSLLAAEFVYNPTTKGYNYIGNKNFSENNNPCLDWKLAETCPDYMRTATDEAVGYVKDNQCRNFGGLYKQPWCYTYINGSNCFKEFCDANEFQQQQDKPTPSRCATLIAANPGFCNNLKLRLYCAKSCNFQTSTLEQCPPGYDPEGPRCITIPPGTYNRTGAVAVCAGKGLGSGLFQILQSFDVDFVRQYRWPRCPNQHLWIDGAQTGSDSALYYTGTDVKALYTNFSSDFNINAVSGCAAALLSETTTSTRQGSTWAFPTSDPNFQQRVVCQTLRIPICFQYVPPADGFVNDTAKPFYYDGDRLAVWCKNNAALSPVYTMCKNFGWTVIQSACADGQGNDKYGTCQEALARNGMFCQLPKASSICPLSCGANGVTAVCTAPSSTTYVRTSANNTCTNGQFMTFACASGRFLIAGDTIRACGVNGTLLGQEPVCVTNPGSLIIGGDLLTPRVSSHLANTVCVLDRDGYRVPIPGNLSAVYCMAVSVGNVTVVVYRKVGANLNFAFVGYVNVFCEPAFTWYVSIPSDQQITVQVGDVVGIYATVANTIHETQCDGQPDSSWQIPCAAVSSLAALNTANLNSTKCIRYSLAYVVTSASSGATTNSVASKLVSEATTSTTGATTTTTRATTTTTGATTTTTRTTTPTTTKRKILFG